MCGLGFRWFRIGSRIMLHSWVQPEVFPWRWQLGTLLINLSLNYFSEFLCPTLQFWASNFIFTEVQECGWLCEKFLLYAHMSITFQISKVRKTRVNK